MTQRFAVAMALGPVGRFIAGGRRSRDLWYASRLLSELTRQAARFVAKQEGTTLVVPLGKRLVPRFFPDVGEAERPAGRQDGPPLEDWQGPVISNKVQFLLEADGGDAVQAVVQEAQEAARGWLTEQLQSLARSKWFEVLDADGDGYARQVEAVRHGDFVEFYAAWSPVDGADETGIEVAFGRAQRLLAARKMARVFPAASFSRPGKPKSSLDPGRDSVLYEPDPGTAWRRLANARIRRMARGIGPNERLDAIDLLRRRAWFVQFGGGRGSGGSSHTQRPRCPFPSLARVAADAWLEGAARAAPALIREVLETIGALEGAGSRDALFLFTSPVRDPGDSTRHGHRSAQFGYDPSILFDGGVEAAKREIELAGAPRFGGVRPHDRKALRDALDGSERDDADQALEVLDRLSARNGPIPSLHRALGVPSSYYAMLYADGDGIGALLKRLGEQDLDKKRRMIRAMDEFADNAWQEVERHRGVAYYVGGDELAVYLPVDRVLEAASGLTKVFHDAVSGAIQAGLDLQDSEVPTLSIGVVIAHRKDDLRAVRQQAEAALQEAKKQRRADSARWSESTSREGYLAIREEPAGGHTRHTVGPTSKTVYRLASWTEALQDPVHAVRPWLDEEAGTWRTAALESPDPVQTRELSLSLAHDLLRLHRRFTGAHREEEKGDEGESNPPGLDLARAMLSIKLRRSGWEDPSPALAGLFGREAIASWGDVRRTAHEILIAARINEVAAQRTPPRNRMDAARTASRRRRRQ